jgi:protein tyrosine/serine phosphatase
VQASQSNSISDTYIGPEIIFSGPRQKVSPEMPDDPGFSSFATSIPNVISRSGQPTIIGFRWLKDHGWKGIVDLRVGGENGQIGDDTNIQGFNELHFNYLTLPIADGSVPSDQQAHKFLEFVTNPLNQPIHVHCRAGVGRTGLMIALYRYMVQGWPIDEAISESRLFSGGVNAIQKNWLERWAQAHKSGSYEKPQGHVVVPK